MNYTASLLPTRPDPPRRSSKTPSSTLCGVFSRCTVSQMGEQMQPGPNDFLLQLVPLVIVQCLLLFAIVPLATASSKRAWAWIVFAIIPILGGFAYPILLGRGIAAVLRRLDSAKNS
jgi:hypothetical protein